MAPGIEMRTLSREEKGVAPTAEGQNERFPTSDGDVSDSDGRRPDDRRVAWVWARGECALVADRQPTGASGEKEAW